MTTTTKPWQRLLPALLLSAAAFSLAHAQEKPAESARATEAAQAWSEARTAAKTGPQDIALAGQATLHLPAGEVFIPQPQATRVMHAMGNPGDYSDLQGLVFPKGDGDWFATLRYEASGYVKDGDAKEWKADELLQTYREGTEASNQDRVKLGVPAMEITGWAEVPKYDEGTHRLVWAMASRNKDAPVGEEPGVNYNTYALGREGYISLNLVTALKSLPTDKGEAQRLLAALDFNEGKRYADFNSSTDKVAEYGLAALVLGVGAKKLGLLALAFAFIAKFAKLFFIGTLAFGGGLMKFFRRNKGSAN